MLMTFNERFSLARHLWAIGTLDVGLDVYNQLAYMDYLNHDYDDRNTIKAMISLHDVEFMAYANAFSQLRTARPKVQEPYNVDIRV